MLGGNSKCFEPFVLSLALEVAIINLLQDHRHAPVPIDQVEGEVRCIQPRFFLVQVKALSPGQHAGRGRGLHQQAPQLKRVIRLHPVGQ